MNEATDDSRTPVARILCGFFCWSAHRENNAHHEIADPVYCKLRWYDEEFLMLKICLTASLMVALLPMNVHGEKMVAEIMDFNKATDFDAVSIFETGAIGPNSLIGDTYSGAPLVQDDTSGFFISDAAPSTHTFDEVAEDGGVNIAGGVDDRFVVTESVVTAGLVQTITVEWTSVDAAGAPTPWVAAGVVGPGGPFTSYRFDVGTSAGGTDPVDDPGSAYIAGSGVFSAFTSALDSLGTFPISPAPAADSSSLFGVGVVGIGGADIAGFDMASMQMSWQMTVPEPSAFSLFAIGCFACLGQRSVSRRRRRAS